MKKLFFFMIMLSFGSVFSQQVTDYRVIEVVKKLKQDSKIDANDRTAWNLLDQTYQVTLQQDQGALENTDFTQKLTSFLDDPNAKNRHLIILYLYYNQLFQNELTNSQPDFESLKEIVLALKNEFIAVYKKEHVMTTILYAEMLQSLGREAEYKEAVARGVKLYPESIPLQIYTAINTNNDAMKSELKRKHPNHWMVLQFLKD